MCWDKERNWRQIIIPENATFDELHRCIDTAFGTEPPGEYIFFDPTRNDILLHLDRPMDVTGVAAHQWSQEILRYSHGLGLGQVAERQCSYLQINYWMEALEERVHFWHFKMFRNRYSCFLVTLKKRLPPTDRQLVGYPSVKYNVDRQFEYHDSSGWQELLDRYSAM